MGDEPSVSGSNEHLRDDEESLDACEDSVVAPGEELNSGQESHVDSGTRSLMAERRNPSRPCSNAIPSKNHNRQQDVSEPARNRHREKTDNSVAARNRASATSSSFRNGQSNQGFVTAPEAVTSEVSENSGADSQLALSTPIKSTNFLGLSPEAIHTAVSTHNWQVRPGDACR